MRTVFPYHIRILLITLLVLLTGCARHASTKECNDLIREDFIAAIQSYDHISSDTLLLQDRMKQSIAEQDTLSQLITLDQLSDAYYELNKYEQALEVLQDFHVLSNKINSKYISIYSANKLAYAYLSINLLDEAARYFYHNLTNCTACAKAPDMVIIEKTEAIMGIGIIHSLLGTNQKALQHLNEAIELSEQIDNRILQGRGYLWKGNTMLNMTEYDSARYYFNESLDISITTNQRSSLGETFYNLGNLEMAEGNSSAAEVNLLNAYNTLSNTTDRINQIRTCNKLGDLYLQLEDSEQAVKYYKEAISIAYKNKLSYYLQHIYHKLFRIYQSEGNERLASRYQSRSYHYANLLNMSKVQTNLMHIQMEYEDQQKLDEIEKISDKYLEISRIQGVIIVASVVIIVLLMIVFLIYYRYVVTRRQRNHMMIQATSIKSNFYKQLTNDFRAPLAIISGVAEKMKSQVTQNGDTPINITDIEVIDEQSKHLTFMINELLAVTNFKMGDKGSWAHGNIVKFVQFLYSAFVEMAQAKSIDFVFHSTTNEIMTDFSKETIRLVINGLLDMLIRQCESEEQVMVMVRHDEVNQKYIIEVNGRCNSMRQVKEMDKIKYITREADKEDVLLDFNEHVNLAKYMIWNVGGEFTIKQEVPHGHAFIIEMPIRNEFQDSFMDIEIPDLPNNVETSMIEEIENIVRYEQNRPTILLVEDNSYMLFYLSYFLKNKYNILKADNGKEAFDLANEKNPDLIVTDWMLPLMDGKTLSESLKENFETSHIPIIMITSKTTVQDKVTALKSGLDAVLQKPFDEHELMATIENLLKNRSRLKKRFMQLPSSLILQDEDDEAYSKNITFLQQITDIIFREMQNSDFFPGGLAKEMFITTTHLNRRIKAATGMNTMNYVNNVKLNRAKKLLVTTQRAIGDIATECGFNDFSYFSRSFKKEFGMTPSQYQRMGSS